LVWVLIMPRYRRKSSEVHAILWTGNIKTQEDVPLWFFMAIKDNLIMPTIDGNILVFDGNVRSHAKEGDYIVKYSDGAIRTRDYDYFHKNYEVI
jgi:hypothetical protein